MDGPEYIYRYELYDTPDEILEAYHRYLDTFSNWVKCVDFLDWFVEKIYKPTEYTPAKEVIWNDTLKKFRKMRRIENRDALNSACYPNPTGKDVLELWLNWEVNNPKTGTIVENKRWILDWLFDEIDHELMLKTN
jgi:hypothetical protein